MKILRIIAASLSLCPTLYTGAMAHEFWIEAKDYQVSADAEVKADLRNGQEFRGGTGGWDPRRSAGLALMFGGQMARLEPRPGDIPAIKLPPQGDGLVGLAFQSTNVLLTYENWETVIGFVEHKDFPWFEGRHDARGLSHDDVKEAYRRYCKALIASGTGQGADQRVGLELEFVALANPYTDDVSGGVPFMLYYGDDPRADAQVEVFDRDRERNVTITKLRTDADGRVVVPVQPGHVYLLDHVELREPDDPALIADGVMWESLWASMTFAVPR